jgi:hypothetical protein
MEEGEGFQHHIEIVFWTLDSYSYSVPSIPTRKRGQKDSRACGNIAKCVSAADPSKRLAEDEENGTLSLTPLQIFK